MCQKKKIEGAEKQRELGAKLKLNRIEYPHTSEQKRPNRIVN